MRQPAPGRRHAARLPAEAWAATTTGASTPRSSARAPTSAWARKTSTCTTSGPWRAWAPSRTARASTWAPATRSSWPTGALLLQGHRDGARGRHAAGRCRPGADGAMQRPRHDRLHRAGATAGRPAGRTRRAPSAPARPGCRDGRGTGRGRDMTRFAERCGVHDARARRPPAQRCCSASSASGIERVRIAWCDLHGMLRGKTLMAAAVAERAARRRRHGQHADAQGHAPTAPPSRCSSPAAPTTCPASAAPTT